MAHTVLVLDALHRKALALARWLGQAGHRVITADTTYWTISRFSRHADRSYVSPRPLADPEAFLDWLQELTATEGIGAVLPADDDTTELLARYQHLLADTVGLLVPPLPSFAAMRDKALSVPWFATGNVPHPHTLTVTNPADLQDAGDRVGYPLVIKARVTAGSRGLRFVRRPADLLAAYEQVHREYPQPIIQKYVRPGPKFMVCLLYDPSGQLALSYVEQVLRQYPVNAGPSTLQESVHRPDLVSLVTPLFEQLPWHGPVHADVMLDGETGEPYVLEVNPRYWQSLHVAQRAGADFAGAHLALACGRRWQPATASYRPGVRGRALVPYDTLAFLKDPGRWQWRPPFFSRYGRDTWDDLLSWSDPGPAFGFVAAVVRHLFDRNMWRTVLRREVVNR